MKIAFLTPEYPHEKINHTAGIGTSIKNLAVALVKKGFSVTVIIYGQKESTVFEENGVTIHLIEDRKYCFAKWFFYRKYIQKFCNKIIREQNIDIIEAPDWTGITAFMKFHIPLVIRFHGSDTYFCYLEKRKQKFKNFWFEKLAIQGANAFITPTSFAGELSKRLFGIKNKKIQTIHYGLELEKFENSNPEVFEKGLLLYIGTIIRKKGVLELTEIFNLVRQQHPEARLVLIGGDSSDIATQSESTWQLLQQQFQEEDLKKVTYLGKIPYQGVQEYIKKAHVCVFPTFAETLGMVTIESMAMQKPVVNSNIGWAKELIIDGKSGFLVHPKNHVEYAAKINSILADKDLAKQLGKNARKRVESIFDIKNIADENITFYKSLID
ncbi:MAG: glycosyltransferase family 4 protein [Flavobacterium sp.]|uniref:glycosyltransferase family 4 protein n=1 Tax=Flavobacterium sp. TaxID=239 RepID=UPI0026133ECC|nr:glycosyltransferase family 4 protein [Flavobacterium sp.]MDD5151088.1 glycosyltransferase family 4 protein [Flavobacterium sp.]